MSDHLKGILIVATGVAVLSPDALILRLLGLDPFTLLFWRGIGMAIVVAAIAWRISPPLRTLGKPLLLTGLLVSVLFSVSQIAFVSGVAFTQAANVLVLVSATPVFAAIASRIILRERLKPRTMVAVVLGMIGVAITVFGSAGGPNAGDLIAALVPICLGLVFTLGRRFGPENILPFFALSGIFSAIAGLLIGTPWSPEYSQFTLIVLLSFFVVPVSFTLISIGPKFIPSAEVGLIMLVETILGPLWIWLGIGEAPGLQAWIGGAILLVTLAVHSWLALREERM